MDNDAKYKKMLNPHSNICYRKYTHLAQLTLNGQIVLETFQGLSDIYLDNNGELIEK